MSDKALAIRTQALTKIFGQRPVIKNLNLEVPRGTIFGFLGQNGAGKTTTMRMLLGLMRASSGTIQLLDKVTVDNGRSQEPARLEVAQRIGALVEGPSFYPFLSGRKNLTLFGRLLGVFESQRIDEALEQVGLLERGHDLFRVYSRGMKQRLGIAAALLHEPELILLDEPMNGLDPPGVMRIRKLLLERAERGATVLLSSHLLNDAEQFCSHVAILHEGLLVAQGRLEELCASDETLLELRVQPIDKALELLSQHEAVASVEQSGEDRLTVAIKGLANHELNRLLVQADLAVSSLLPKKRTLENLFLQSTQAPQVVRNEEAPAK